MTMVLKFKRVHSERIFHFLKLNEIEFEVEFAARYLFNNSFLGTNLLLKP